MTYYKAVFNTSRKVEEKAPEERDIHAKMSVNTLFSDPPVPYPDFLVALDQQSKAIEQAQYGGIERIATMRSKERVVDDMVRKLRTYVSLKADGDINIILSSGFRHTKPRESAGSMPQITGVKNLKTDLSGALKLKWIPVKNASFYEVQVREVVSEQPKPKSVSPPDTEPDDSVGLDEVIVERLWEPFSTKPSRMEITGLKSLKYYEVRVRANGAKGFGPFSDTTTMVVT